MGDSNRYNSKDPGKNGWKDNRKRRGHQNNLDYEEGPPNKRNLQGSFLGNKTENNGTSAQSKAAKIMRLMGYKEGFGLGKEGQGIVEPVRVEERKGRRGLGHVASAESQVPVPGELEWNIQEYIEIQEKVGWIPHFPTVTKSPAPPLEILRTWLKIGPKKLIIDDETNFVDANILKWILTCKSALDEISPNDLFKARSRSNPYETIRKGIFINRAAMKMANIDAVLDFQVTSPKTPTGADVLQLSETGNDDLLYFADICAGPGGFSEYILWKKRWEAKGFGFTLKGDCDFKLSDFISGPPESFEAHYGVDQDGDIYNPENCTSFISYVKKHSDGQGVHFVMADGGFSVDGQENIQEILSRQLYLSQAMVALGIIRKGGHFICKLFDVFTPFSVGLVYLMRFCFHEVALLKPNTSRPANSERYLICKWRKSDISSVFCYLKECHELMWSWTKITKSSLDDKEGLDLMEIVPLDLLKDEDDPFFNYVLQGNNQNGVRQIQNLRKIVSFWDDYSLKEERQFETRNLCLEFWNIPNETRHRDPPLNPVDKFYSILEQTRCRNNSFENTSDKDLTPTVRANEFRSPYNWKFCAVENGTFKKNRGFFMSTGGTRLFKCNNYGKWEPLDSYVKFQMSNDTLVYGEIVTEYELKGDNDKPTKNLVFHIIDGIILGGKDVRGLSLMEREVSSNMEFRNGMCRKFAKSMNKTYSVSGYGSYRTKELIPLEEFRAFHSCLESRVLPGLGKIDKVTCPVTLFDDAGNSKNIIQPGGLLFLPEVAEQWLIAISRTHDKKYYFDKSNGYKTFEMPPNAVTDFVIAMRRRVFWEWDKDVDLNYPRSQDAPSFANKVHAQELIDYIEKIRKDGVK